MTIGIKIRATFLKEVTDKLEKENVDYGFWGAEGFLLGNKVKEIELTCDTPTDFERFKKIVGPYKV